MFNIACMINFFVLVARAVKIKKERREKCYNIKHYMIKRRKMPVRCVYVRCNKFHNSSGVPFSVAILCCVSLRWIAFFLPSVNEKNEHEIYCGFKEWTSEIPLDESKWKNEDGKFNKKLILQGKGGLRARSLKSRPHKGTWPRLRGWDVTETNNI